jgi:minor extracellular serine protease Vpr
VLLVGGLFALDRVRVEIRSDQASAKYGVTGKGVIFAMIDRGIDWQNNDFRNPDGTTRIAYIFDLTDNTGQKAANNPYSEGTIYTKSQINQALQGGAPLAERDFLGHGTANTAIAVGNGRNTPKYRGIAPDATIISVKLVNDATPAFGNTPAIPAFYDPSLIPIAINFIVAKAKELGMPCVMVMDIGSIAGPTDGTSSYSRLIDATVGNQPGLIFIPGTGDDGGMANHASASVPQGGALTLKLRKGFPGALSIDVWYAGSDVFDVSVQTPDLTYGPFPAPANDSVDVRTNLGEVAYYHYGANANDPWGSMNGKSEINIAVNPDSANGEYAITFSGRTVVNGRFDATMNPSREWDGSSANFFENFVVPGSISDFASAHNAVIDTCYVIRTGWTDLDGIARSLSNQGDVGQLWVGTSIGPTFDGRRSIDISSPAEEIVTAYDPKSYWATARSTRLMMAMDCTAWVAPIARRTRSQRALLR